MGICVGGEGTLKVDPANKIFFFLVHPVPNLGKGGGGAILGYPEYLPNSII